MARSGRLGIALAAAALLLASAVASQAAPLKLRGEGTTFASVPVEQASNDRENVDITYRWRVWTLVGEPVQSANIKWQLPAVRTLPLPPEAEGKTIRLSELPDNVRADVQLYDVVLAIRGKLRATGETAFFLIDAGVPGRAGGKWSFNVPGSPDWSGVLFRQRASSFTKHVVGSRDDYEAYAAADAKTALKGGFDPFDGEGAVTLVSARLDVSAVWTWWRKNQSAKKSYTAYRRAADRGAKALRRLMDADTTALARRLGEARRAADRSDYVSATELARKAAAPFQKALPALARLATKVRTEDGRMLSINELYEAERSVLLHELSWALNDIPAVQAEPSVAGPWREAKRRELESRSKLPFAEPAPVFVWLELHLREAKGEDRKALLCGMTTASSEERSAYVEEPYRHVFWQRVSGNDAPATRLITERPAGQTMDGVDRSPVMQRFAKRVEALPVYQRRDTNPEYFRGIETLYSTKKYEKYFAYHGDIILIDDQHTSDQLNRLFCGYRAKIAKDAGFTEVAVVNIGAF